MTAHTFTLPDAGTLNYRIYVPASFSAGKKVPLVLFLHGAGERGDDNLKQLKHGVTNILNFVQKTGEAIVIAPQCPANKRWVEVDWNTQTHSMPAEPSLPMKLVLALLEDVLQKYPVDQNKLYVTGVSMGGYGTWDLIQRRPKLVAAAIPICGGGDPALAPMIKNVNIWIFHGGSDTVVPVVRSQNMYTALKACGGHVQYTEYPNVNHDAWTRTYANADVLTWMFKQTRHP